MHSGRLRRSLVVGKDGKAKVADLELADREWAENTDLTKAPGSVKQRAAGETEEPAAPEEPSADDAATSKFVLTQELAREKHWKAKRAELDYKEKAAQLVDGEKARSWIVEKFSLVRSRMLSVPSKAKLALPHLSHVDVLALDTIVRESLEELAAEAAVPAAAVDPPMTDVQTEGSAA